MSRAGTPMRSGTLLADLLRAARVQVGAVDAVGVHTLCAHWDIYTHVCPSSPHTRPCCAPCQPQLREEHWSADLQWGELPADQGSTHADSPHPFQQARNQVNSPALLWTAESLMILGCPFVAVSFFCMLFCVCVSSSFVTARSLFVAGCLGLFACVRRTRKASCTTRPRAHTHIFNPCSLLGPLMAWFTGGGRDTQLPELGSALTCVLDSPSPLTPLPYLCFQVHCSAQGLVCTSPASPARCSLAGEQSKHTRHRAPTASSRLASIRRLRQWR